MNTTFTAADWWHLLLHFASLSLLAVGGPMSTAPGMHRFLVTRQHWLADAQFSSSIAIAQAAPGPNALFVALLGWDVGLNAAGGAAAGWHALPSAALGMVLAMSGLLAPALFVNYHASRWTFRNRHLRVVRAFKAGMAPIVVAMMLSTGWLLSAANGSPLHAWHLWLLTAASTVVVWRTRLHLLWLIAAGAALGALGLV